MNNLSAKIMICIMQNEISTRTPFIIMESNNSRNGTTHTRISALAENGIVRIHNRQPLRISKNCRIKLQLKWSNLCRAVQCQWEIPLCEFRMLDQWQHKDDGKKNVCGCLFISWGVRACVCRHAVCIRKYGISLSLSLSP